MLFYLTIENYPLLIIGILILSKEIILFFLRLNFLKSEIIDFKIYYFFSLYFLFVLFLSFYNQNLYYLSLIPLIIIFFKK